MEMRTATISVPSAMWKEFKFIADLDNRKISNVVTRLVYDYIENKVQEGILGEATTNSFEEEEMLVNLFERYERNLDEEFPIGSLDSNYDIKPGSETIADKADYITNIAYEPMEH